MKSGKHVREIVTVTTVNDHTKPTNEQDGSRLEKKTCFGHAIICRSSPAEDVTVPGQAVFIVFCSNGDNN